MKNLLYIFCAAIICIGSTNIAGAQTKNDKKAAKIKEIAMMVDGKNFLFDATFVTPFRGGGHSLSGPYDLTVSADTVSAYLPFFGQAYLADYASNEGGIKFTWTNFIYKVTVKKDGKEIYIEPKNKNAAEPRGVQSLRLYIYSDGYATLQVTNLNRDPISFNGTIEERHPKTQASL